MYHYHEANSSCRKITNHLARSKLDCQCVFCGIDTSSFTKEDWNDQCDAAIRQNISREHDYQVSHIQGMAVRDQDYVQIIYYRCTICDNTFVERDDQR